MPKQFGYQDESGFFYSDHPALRFEPGLVPGFLDTDTKTFQPTGNPREQTGTIITDAGFGGGETLHSGLREDKGADTAPLQGVAFTQTNAQAELAERDAELVETKRQLEEANRENAQLRAREELTHNADPDTDADPEPEPFVGPPRPEAAQTGEQDDADPDPNPAPPGRRKTVRRGRKTS